MKVFAKFITVDGEKVEIDPFEEVIVHLTGEIIHAWKAKHTEPILIPEKVGLGSEVIAIRDPANERRTARRILHGED